MNQQDAAACSRWFDESVAVRRRTELSVLHVTGEDSRTWLNGQISNDVRQMSEGDAVYALVLNIRGKILADVWALDRGDFFSLLVPSAAVDTLIAHLEQYVIMEDVALTRAPEVAVISVQGPRSHDLLNDNGMTVFACDDLGASGFHTLANEADVPALLRKLGDSASALGGGCVDEQAYEIARVRRGVPRFGRDFDLQHYPQEAGLKQRAVSFSKGCYLGQEVVCTLESRGKLSRKLVSLTFEGEAPAPGDALLTESGDESGAITSVTTTPGIQHALGYVRRIHIEARCSLRTKGSTTLSLVHVIGET